MAIEHNKYPGMSSRIFLAPALASLAWPARGVPRTRPKIEAMASNLIAQGTPIAMASNLLAMAFNLVAMASNLGAQLHIL